MTEWLKGNELEKRARRAAISAAPCGSAPIRRCSQRGSRVAEIYGATEISERHRHRYEVNTGYKGRLEQHGMRFSGMSPDGLLPEIVEYADHPWFIGVQFHPELKSRPFEPHPLFASLHRRGGGAEPAGVSLYRFLSRESAAGGDVRARCLCRNACSSPKILRRCYAGSHTMAAFLIRKYPQLRGQRTMRHLITAAAALAAAGMISSTAVRAEPLF